MSPALPPALLLPATAACLYYVAPTLAAPRPRARARRAEPRHTFAVLIPARDEEAPLPATLGSVLTLDYPADTVRVYVVADNCSDRTAEVARAAGVLVLERHDPKRPGKGH